MTVKFGSIKTIQGKKGNTYCVQIRMKGHPHISKTFKELKEAKSWLKETSYAMSTGQAYETKVMRTQTFAQLIDKYIEEKVDKTSSNYITRLGQLLWWKEQLGYLTLNIIKEDVISAARLNLQNIRDRFGNPRSNATINRYMTTLSVVLGVASREWRLLPYNPLKNFQKLKEPPGRDRFLSENEVERLLASCKESKNKHLYDIVLLALCTGMRKGEIAHLKWSDIDFEGEVIKLEHTKNGDKRYVPLKNPILSLLKQKAIKSSTTPFGYVFSGPIVNQPINFRNA